MARLHADVGDARQKLGVAEGMLQEMRTRCQHQAEELQSLRTSLSEGEIRKSLLERDLIVPAGRKPVVGRPMVYATTQKFLLHFGLKNLEDLPRLADFGEGNLEAQALAQLEPPMPEGGLFDGVEGE